MGIYIVDAVRTAVGNFNGSLSTVSASKLGEEVIRALVERSKIDPNNVNEVIMGQVLTGGAGQNPARQASVNAGIPNTIPAFTINKVCGSGLKSVALAYQSILAGDNEIVIAGGQENMSLAMHAIHMRSGVKMGDAKMIDMMMIDGLTDAFNNYAMGITAENIAQKFNISRERQDEFSKDSQNKAEAAQKAGKFEEEIIPVKIITRKEEIVFKNDEFIRHGATTDAFAKLKPAFIKDGTVTAGNSSGINDGAAATLVMSEAQMKKHNLTPMARIVGAASAGVDPTIMGTGPIAAVTKLLAKINWNINDVDLFEANEAFAAQAISVADGLKLDPAKVNVNGGAIAIGHPIGASGTRVLTTLLYEMKRRNVKKGVATLCIGGGMGVALAVERL